VITSIAPLTWIDSDTLQLDHSEGPIIIDAANAHITCGWMNLTGIKQQYSKVGFHERLSLVGSHDELEIAVNQGNAAEVMSLKIGDVVSLHRASR
jgi:S-adenosylmethionine hydrolase